MIQVCHIGLRTAVACVIDGSGQREEDLSRLGRVVEQDRLDHPGKDFGNVDAHDLGYHLWEVDTGLQRLGLDEQVIRELVQLFHNSLKVVEQLRELEQPLCAGGLSMVTD